MFKEGINCSFSSPDLERKEGNRGRRWSLADSERLEEKEIAAVAGESLVGWELYNHPETPDLPIFLPLVGGGRDSVTRLELEERLGTSWNRLDDAWEEIKGKIPIEGQRWIERNRVCYSSLAALFLIEGFIKKTFDRAPVLDGTPAGWEEIEAFRGMKERSGLIFLLGNRLGREEALFRIRQEIKGSSLHDYIFPPVLADSLERENAGSFLTWLSLPRLENWQVILERSYPHLLAGWSSPFDRYRFDLIKESLGNLKRKEIISWLGMPEKYLEEISIGEMRAKPEILEKAYHVFLDRLSADHLVFYQAPLGWESLVVLARRLKVSRSALGKVYRRSLGEEAWETLPRLFKLHAMGKDTYRLPRLVPVYPLIFLLPELQESILCVGEKRDLDVSLVVEVSEKERPKNFEEFEEWILALSEENMEFLENVFSKEELEEMGLVGLRGLVSTGDIVDGVTEIEGDFEKVILPKVEEICKACSVEIDFGNRRGSILAEAERRAEAKAEEIFLVDEPVDEKEGSTGSEEFLGKVLPSESFAKALRDLDRYQKDTVEEITAIANNRR